MTPRPFLVRLIPLFALAMAVIVAVCGGVIYWGGEQTARRQQIADLERLSALVRQWLPTDGALTEADRSRLADSAHVLGTRITLVDGPGKVLFDTDADAGPMENHNDRPEVVEARREVSGSGVRYSSTIHEPAVYVARLVDPARPDGRVLRLSYPRRVWVARMGTSAWLVMAGAVACALLLTALLSVLLQRQWITPVRRLATAAERMASGDWGQRVAPRGADDVRFFSDKLNLVASQAERQLADLRHQRADLRALVDMLPDPILVVDPQRNVALMNQPAASLLRVDAERAAGRPVASLSGDESLVALVESAVGGAGAPPQSQLRASRNGQQLTFHCVAVRTAGGGAVLVLRDVSALASTLQMKTDFVANASHELRTPIAAIKIAFETLRDCYADDPNQARRCVEIIDGHMGRLEEMLQDLMDLSRVESAELRPHLRTLKLASLFASVRSGLGALARQKGVELRFEDQGEATVETDERLMNLVLKNLVENSVKFTPAGGSVTVSWSPGRDGTALISVADTGIGIPPEHLERVFERFYQVDAARSGSAGRGTGLGLAIVKHAVAALGGTVRIESAVSKGTTVTCGLPQARQRPMTNDEARMTDQAQMPE